MVDIIDFTCEIQVHFFFLFLFLFESFFVQNKFNIDISDEVMYLDFIQLKDVYNYLYQLKPGEGQSKSSNMSASSDKVRRKQRAAFGLFLNVGKDFHASQRQGKARAWRCQSIW
jgi:hypothetical protein